MQPTRYPAPLVALHWLMAAVVLGMLASGLLVGSALLPKMQEYQLIQWHKAFGVGVLWLAVLRVGVRLWAMAGKHIPPAPLGTKPWEVMAARWGHLGLYGAMLAIPFTGWLMVSASPYGLPTVLFGNVIWPNLPIPEAYKTWAFGAAKESHELLAFGLLGLLAVHIGAVVKHYYTDKTNILPRIWFGVVAMLVFMVTSVQAAPYVVDYPKSTLSFKGSHAGAEFRGKFTNWQAVIEFDESSLATSKVTASFATASAKTGNVSYDGALPTADWLNSEKYPTATFTSTEMTKGAKQFTYNAKGALTLRGVTQPVTMVFTLTPIVGNPTGALRAMGALTLDRLAFGVGAQSDGAAEWVSRAITVTIDLTATPASPN